MIRMVVMEYNINGGAHLDAVADTIRARNADVVLLNEVHWRPGLPWRPDARNDQTSYLAYAVGYAHKEYRHATVLGFAGTKGVSILSRYPIHDARMHMVPGTMIVGGYGTLEATLDVSGRQHRVFSTRFPPMHTPDHKYFDPAAETKNRAGHEQALELIRKVPASVPIIYGGDLNAAWDHLSPTGGPPPGEWARQFRDDCGLQEFLVASLDPDASPEEKARPAGRVDFIYFRGPYRVESVEFEFGVPGASDHAYLVGALTERVHPDPQRPDPCGELRQAIRGVAEAVAALQAELRLSSGRPKYATVRMIRKEQQRLEALRAEALARGCTDIP